MKRNNKLKIAIVSDAIYPYNKGGKEKRIYEISRRYARNGHDIHIYCMKWWKGKGKDRIENGVHLHAISRLYPLYSGERRSILQAFLYALACFRLIKEDFDVMDVDHMPHLVLFSTKLVCWLKRKKLIATWNEVWGRKYWKEYLGKLGNIAYIIEYLSARMPDKIIAVSEHTKNRLINELKIKKEIFVISNGIDFDYIKKIKPAQEKSDIIFAGRLLSHKNVDVLVKSINIIKKDYSEIKVFIIGDGPEKENLQKLTHELHLENNIKYFGFLENHKDLYSLIKSSKVFVFPSTREGFGIAALEANACGIPFITIDHKANAARYLLNGKGNGYLASLNGASLSRKLVRFLRTDYKGKQKICLDYAKHFSWDTIYEDNKHIYE